jgi:hypothetical protein
MKMSNIYQYSKFIFSFIFLALDRDPGPGYIKSLNPDPMRIRIHNPAYADNFHMNVV